MSKKALIKGVKMRLDRELSILEHKLICITEATILNRMKEGESFQKAKKEVFNQFDDCMKRVKNIVLTSVKIKRNE